jgi:energy-coupling factor transport system permease protein
VDKTFAYSFKDYPLTGKFWWDLNPMTKFIISMCVAISAIVVYNWRYALVLLILYFIMAAAIGIGKSYAKAMAGIGLLLLIFTVIIRQIGHRDINQTLLFSIWGWDWYWESLDAALNIVGYMVGFAGALLIFFMTTPMRDIMYTLEQKGVGHEASFIMLSSMQSITDMKKSANTIMESQKARGIETEGNMIVRAKAFLPTLGPIVLGAMSGTEEKSIAMEARAFSYEGKHTTLRDLRPTTKLEIVLDVIAVVYLLVCIAYRVAIATGVIG